MSKYLAYLYVVQCNVCNEREGCKGLCVLKVRNIILIIYWFYTPYLVPGYNIILNLKLLPPEITPPIVSPSRVNSVHAADFRGIPDRVKPKRYRARSLRRLAHAKRKSATLGARYHEKCVR